MLKLQFEAGIRTVGHNLEKVLWSYSQLLTRIDETQRKRSHLYLKNLLSMVLLVSLANTSVCYATWYNLVYRIDVSLEDFRGRPSHRAAIAQPSGSHTASHSG